MISSQHNLKNRANTRIPHVLNLMSQSQLCKQNTVPFNFFDFKTIISPHSPSLYTPSTPGQWQPHNVHSVSLLCFSLPLQCCLTLPPGAASSQSDQRGWQVAQKWCRARGSLWEQFWFFISVPRSWAVPMSTFSPVPQCQGLSPYNLSAVAVPERTSSKCSDHSICNLLPFKKSLSKASHAD